MNDLRYAARTLARDRGFTLAAAGLLAAGIGVTTLIFSAVDAILLRPLPVPHPEQLVRLVQRMPRQGNVSEIPLPAYDALRDRSTTLSAVFGEREERLPLTDPPSELVAIHLSTPNFFDALGVHAALGRTLTAADGVEAPGDPPAVLSYAFWQRRFLGDPQAIGKTIRIKGNPFVIVGVLPRDFNGFAADTAPDLRVPLRVWRVLDPGLRGPEYLNLELAGRLKPGVRIETAQAETRTIWAATLKALNQGELSTVRGRDVSHPLELDSLEHGTSILRDRYAVALQFLIACASFLLLMVCANVAGLLLARGAARRQEIAVRLAVGATRARLAAQMLVESGLLAALGAAGGIAVAAALTPMLARLLPPIHDLGANRLTLSLGLSMDRRVLLFSLALSALTVLLFGLAPAIAASRTSLDSVLRGARSTSRWRGRQALILIQVALCTLLLTGAGLLIRTFEQLRGLNPGFDAQHVITFTIESPILYREGERIEDLQKRTVAFYDTLQERIRETPGVGSVALAARSVMRDRGFGTTVARVGERSTVADYLSVGVNYVTRDYFATMGIPLLEGRLLSGSPFELPKPEPVMVNQAFVQRYFPGLDPIGKRFGAAMSTDQPAKPDSEIIGVVGDTKYRSLREPIQPIIYHLYAHFEGPMMIHVSARIKPESLIQPIRRTINSFDPAMPIVEIDTLADEVNASAAGERLTAALGTLFALLAVLLSAAGIYGLLAYSVTQRRREIGVRMALGATPGNIGELVGRQALLTVIVGMVLGLGIARLASPLIAALLYGIAAGDARTLAGAAVAVLAMAFLASAIPAARAARLNPAVVLRDD